MKKFLTALCLPFLLFAHIAQGEMVDTFQFQNDQERLRAVALAKSLRCPQCQNQNLVESNSPIAYDLRLEVYQMVNQGKTDEQIVQAMTARFGDFVRYNPPFQTSTLLLWGLPFLLLALALAFMAKYLRQRNKAPTEIQLDNAEQQALAELLNKDKL